MGSGEPLNWPLLGGFLLAAGVFLSLVALINRRRAGSLLSPNVSEPSGWIIALWWVGGALPTFVLGSILVAVSGIPAGSRGYDAAMGAVCGATFTAPIVPYHFWVTRGGGGRRSGRRRARA
ncbi:MAG: hypothetical protein QOE90_3414 [Thermoplasmata archaeon]|jgi:hypothetical protein|nr:hypothetical protein [Thermoplasmata archaeon]